MSVKYPPVNVPFVDDNGRVTKKWREWWRTVDKRFTEVSSGGATGNVLGDVNTGFEISTDADVYINGLKLTSPTAEGQVAIYQSDEISWIDPETLAATPTGTVRSIVDDTIPDGWILLDDGTIGSAASGATTRANADTEDLYTQIWNSVSDTYAPVSSGRGASAAADFAANKTLQLCNVAGRAIRVMAGTGVLGATNGAETRSMVENELPEHKHIFSGRILGGAVSNSGFQLQAPMYYPPYIDPYWRDRWDTYKAGSYTDWSNDPVGNDPADDQNIMQETAFFKYMIKL